MLSGKHLLLSILVLSSLPAFAVSPCNGEQGYEYVNYKHRNPTKGGFVSYNAFVDDTDDVYIAPTATVCGSSHVSDHARIYGTAVIDGANVSGNAEIFGQARITDGAEISENAKISENALVSGSVRIFGSAVIAGNAKITNYSQDYLAQVSDKARVSGNAEISQNAQISGNARIYGNAKIFGDASVSGMAVVFGYTKLSSGSLSSGSKNDPDYEGIEKARIAAEAEKARLAAEAIKRAQEEALRNKANIAKAEKIAKYNDLGKQAKEGNWLGGESAKNSVMIRDCRLINIYRRKMELSFNINLEIKTVLDIDMSEPVKFSAKKVPLIGNCIAVDVTNTKNSELTISDFQDQNQRYPGKTDCMGATYNSQSDAETVARILNDMAANCRGI